MSPGIEVGVDEAIEPDHVGAEAVLADGTELVAVVQVEVVVRRATPEEPEVAPLDLEVARRLDDVGKGLVLLEIEVAVILVDGARGAAVGDADERIVARLGANRDPVGDRRIQVHLQVVVPRELQGVGRPSAPEAEREDERLQSGTNSGIHQVSPHCVRFIATRVADILMDDFE